MNRDALILSSYDIIRTFWQLQPRILTVIICGPNFRAQCNQKKKSVSNRLLRWFSARKYEMRRIAPVDHARTCKEHVFALRKMVRLARNSIVCAGKLEYESHQLRF